MYVQPYLFFEGRCEEAAEFYRKALGAEVTLLVRFKDSPEDQEEIAAAGIGDKALHMTLRIGDTMLLASDSRCGGHPTFHGFALSLTVKNEDEAERALGALADGGQVQMPLTKTFFSPGSA